MKRIIRNATNSLYLPARQAKKHTRNVWWTWRNECVYVNLRRSECQNPIVCFEKIWESYLPKTTTHNMHICKITAKEQFEFFAARHSPTKAWHHGCRGLAFRLFVRMTFQAFGVPSLKCKRLMQASPPFTQQRPPDHLDLLEMVQAEIMENVYLIRVPA